MGRDCLRTACLAIVLLLVLAVPDSGPAGRSAADTANVAVTRDAHVDEANPSANYGPSNVLFSGPQGSAGLNMDLVTYLYFDLQPFIPQGSTVTGVTLRINSLFTLRSAVYVHEAPSSWTESTVTWSNRPAWLPSVLASLTSGSSGWWSISGPSLTSAIQAWVNNYATAPRTLVLKSDLDQGSRNEYNSYYSRESGLGSPALVVTFSPPADTTPPVVYIASPLNGQTFTTTPIAVSGNATDVGSPNSGVNRVEVRVNAGAWSVASGTNVWSATVPLSQGSNTIDARAFDNAGLASTIASITVSYNPPTNPMLAYTPAVLDFGVVAPGFSGSRAFQIRNDGTGTLSYSLAESSPWISAVTPASGTSTGEWDDITVAIDTTGLTAGDYADQVSISSNGGSGAVTVDVTVASSPSHGIYQFDLVVSLQGDGTTTFFGPFVSGLRKAVNYLWDASEGQFWIRRVEIYENSQKWAAADIRVYNQAEWPRVDVVGGISGSPKGYIILGLGWDGQLSVDPATWDTPNGFRTIIHEFGHYGLWSYDEYLRADGSKIPVSSMMRTVMAWQYGNTEFSIRSDYTNPPPGVDTNTRQWAVYRKSTWEVIKDRYPLVTIPTTTRPGPLDNVGADTVIEVFESTIGSLEDTDGDGVPDITDDFPNDPSEITDHDKDGIGDNADPDDDGDGIRDSLEIALGYNPRNPDERPPDTDGDGLPDEYDEDDDDDGYPDSVEDAYGTDPRDAGDHPVPPVIAHGPLAPVQPSGRPLRIEASVTDPDGDLSFDDVRMYFSTDGGSSWTHGRMDRLEGTDRFVRTIPSQPGGVVVLYYIEASDTYGHVSRNPSGADQHHEFTTENPEGPPPSYSAWFWTTVILGVALAIVVVGWLVYARRRRS